MVPPSMPTPGWPIGLKLQILLVPVFLTGVFYFLFAFGKFEKLETLMYLKTKEYK